MQEKRYRSMQEHIRRAHPEHYIAKLPATEESFALMVNTPPSERPPPPPSAQSGPSGSSSLHVIECDRSSQEQGLGHDGEIHHLDRHSSTATPRTSDELRRSSLLPAASAAAALAQLHYHRPESDWDSEHVRGHALFSGPAGPLMPGIHQETHSDIEHNSKLRPAHFGHSTLEQQALLDGKFPHGKLPGPRELLPSSLSRSPPGRSSTLPPIPRSVKPARPRKSSITQNSRRPKHERTRSKDHMRRISHERKAFSAEPQSAAAIFGKRWEDLIDAATSANEEESSRELTPVSIVKPLYDLKLTSRQDCRISYSQDSHHSASFCCLPFLGVCGITAAEDPDSASP